MELDTIPDRPETEIGSYFVANYPPFSAWREDWVPEALRVLSTPAKGSPTPLGLYLHIPFCRTRCKFCYFRVYTDKNAREVDVYLDALQREVALYAESGGLAGRDFEFVYFGGGTPSFLSSDQLQSLIEGIARHWRWDRAQEVTFECEPGTLKKQKLETIKAIGTTRLSLGIEHFDDDILEANGRAHKSPEVFRSFEWAREVGFEQINIDLIAGMVGDTEAKWRLAVEKALALDADSLTVYQMEVPHNTLLARGAREMGEPVPVASWSTKRNWVDHAFRRFEEAGYVVSSAYTVVKPTSKARFVYRDSLWRGADLLGTGVASFSHFGGVHFQNVDQWDDYVARLLDSNELPLARALPLTDHQRLTREVILQLKLGRLDAGYFRSKFGVEIANVFGKVIAVLESQGYLTREGDRIELSRPGLLRVDALLPEFFEPVFRGIRYT
jgi:oxygen-independent coproporphyrinogen-3 oxidase